MGSNEVPVIDWSFSNARLFKQCPRAFYYKNHRRESSAESSGEFADSVELEYHGSPGALVGDAVHQCISSELDQWCHGESVQMHRLLETADDALAEVIERSVSLGAETEASNRWSDRESLRHSIRSHLQRFIQVIWPRYQAHSYLLHEQNRSFEVATNTVWVRPDLVTRNPAGELVITDWKTTPSIESKYDLQLQVYALWANHELEPDIDRIKAQIVKTSDGDVYSVPVETTALENARERICSDSTKWNEIQDCDGFKPLPEKEKCASCPYLPQCEVGKRKCRMNPDWNSNIN